MRIGLIFAIYNCEEYVERCLSPWFEVKQDVDITTTVTSGRFKDYIDLGIPNKNSKTLQKLVGWNFDFMSITNGENLLDEDSSRNLCLNFLKSFDCDLIWLVDGDEFYTKEQILDILEYIKNTPDKEAYSIWLKNYTVRIPLFLNWLRPSIYRNRIYGGISRFYFDSYFVYEDGIHGIKDVEVQEIPKRIAFIEHHTWLENESTRDKIYYQNMRYHGVNNENPEGCRCSIEWDEFGIKFSESFFNCRGWQIPTLSEYPTDSYDESLTLNFERRENKITISSETRLEKLKIKVFDLVTGDFINEFKFEELEIGVVYWVIPIVDFDFCETIGFKVHFYEDSASSPFHMENIYLKTR